MCFQVLFNQISVAGWKPVSSETKEDVNEEEVHQLFNLIDTDRTGFITPTVRFKQHLTIYMNIYKTQNIIYSPF